MPGLVKDQIKLFQASKFTQIVVTDVNKVYRWRTEIDKAYTECSFEKTEESRMGMLGGLGKNLLFSVAFFFFYLFPPSAIVSAHSNL